MTSMKVSVSLPEADIKFLDSYARARGYESRSAAVHQAVDLLRTSGLTEAYADAWEQWTTAGEAEVWDAAIGDGIGG